MYPPSLVAVEEEEPHFDSMTGLQEQDAEPALVSGIYGFPNYHRSPLTPRWPLFTVLGPVEWLIDLFIATLLSSLFIASPLDWLIE
jgi:hypothetical protein